MHLWIVNRWIVCREIEELSCPSPRTSALPDIRVKQESPFQYMIDFNQLFWTKAQNMGLKKRCIYQSWPTFVFTNPGLQFYYQPRAFACICRPCVVNLYLYLRPWPIITITDPGPEFAVTILLAVVGSGSSNSSCSNFFGIDNTKFSIPILVD